MVLCHLLSLYRWSNSQPVPSLGDDDSTFEEVDEFYKVW